MIALVGRRLASMIPVLLLVVVMVFSLTRLIPGDPATSLLGPGATTAQIAALRHQLHVDEPLARQLVDYVAGLAHGDLGVSMKTGIPVRSELAAKVPATIELAVAALLLAIVVGIPMGVVAARRPNGPVDHGLRLLALSGVSMPAFLLALFLQYLFGARLGWLPVASRSSPYLLDTPTTGFILLDAALAGDPLAFWDGVRHLILPAIVLASFLAASLSRFIRNTMIGVMSEDFVRTAEAKGLSPQIILYRHALRNAILPAIAVVGLQFGEMLGGAILTETVFSWPGVGRYTVEAIRNRDYPVIQSATLAFAVLFMASTLAADLLSMTLDPRLRSRGR